MSREKSQFVSSFGTAFQIFKTIADAVLAAGGGDDDLRQVLSNKNFVKEIASLIVSVKRQIFKVLVDYTKSLKEMIEAGQYDWVSDDITSDHFPVKGVGQKEVEITLFHFNRDISSDGAIAEMAKAGYRPALSEELLALGAIEKELQKQFPIVALGSVWQSLLGRRRVPYLSWGRAERFLHLDWFEYAWPGAWRFAAVRK